MIALGVILLIVGLITGLSILTTVGGILLVIGSTGHALGGRRHYF